MCKVLFFQTFTKILKYFFFFITSIYQINTQKNMMLKYANELRPYQFIYLCLCVFREDWADWVLSFTVSAAEQHREILHLQRLPDGSSLLRDGRVDHLQTHRGHFWNSGDSSVNFNVDERVNDSFTSVAHLLSTVGGVLRGDDSGAGRIRHSHWLSAE